MQLQKNCFVVRHNGTCSPCKRHDVCIKHVLFLVATFVYVSMHVRMQILVCYHLKNKSSRCKLIRPPT